MFMILLVRRTIGVAACLALLGGLARARRNASKSWTGNSWMSLNGMCRIRSIHISLVFLLSLTNIATSDDFNDMQTAMNAMNAKTSLCPSNTQPVDIGTLEDRCGTPDRCGKAANHTFNKKCSDEWWVCHKQYGSDQEFANKYNKLLRERCPESRRQKPRLVTRKDPGAGTATNSPTGVPPKQNPIITSPPTASTVPPADRSLADFPPLDGDKYKPVLAITNGSYMTNDDGTVDYYSKEGGKWFRTTYQSGSATPSGNKEEVKFVTAPDEKDEFGNVTKPGGGILVIGSNPGSTPKLLPGPGNVGIGPGDHPHR
jgi:hypothetical protein